MSAPKIRSSQLITTFGIGSIINTPDWSGMIAGQDFWRSDAMNVIHEPRLQVKLGVDEFHIPKPWKKPMHGAREVLSVPAVRFPLWHFCPKCKILADLQAFGGYLETKCRRCSVPLVPARFIVACKDGHISDFPWHWWVHRGAACSGSKLEISSSGRSTSLASIIVTCTKCEKHNSLEKIFDPRELAGLTCPGTRPWLKDREPCGNRLTVVQRGASNVYFPVMESAVSIPPFSSAAAKIIEKYWAFLATEAEVEKNRDAISRIAKTEKKDFDDLWTSYLTRKNLSAGKSSQDIRCDEYVALSEPPPMDETSDFAAEAVAIPPGHEWLQKVVLVRRLRVVTALDSFFRISSTEGKAAPLGTTATNWRPGMEVHGEGIFLRLHPEALKDWKLRAGGLLDARVERLESRRQDLIRRKFRAYGSPVTPELLLIHTLSHLFVRALILECGYSSSSLREILYVRPASENSGGMNGLLIYTAAADSEGSLGGLVRQGEPDRLGSILSEAVESARWCSNDPLCLESLAQGTNSLNLASCHSCSLVPETTCEMFNSFLDRGVVVGTQEHPELGFFPLHENG